MEEKEEQQALRSVTRQNAESILAARQHAEQDLLRVKEALELKTIELREGAEHMRLALLAGHQGDWRWDAQSDQVSLSPRALEIFGLPSGSDVTWTEMRDLLHKDDAERARLAVEKAVVEKSDYDIEYRVNRPSGEQCWIAAKGRGTYAPEGPVTGMIGTVQDITKRKQAEESLRETEARLRMAMEAGQMGAWEWDIGSGKVTWSPNLEALHGLPPGKFGGTFEDFQRDMHPEDRDKVLAAVRASLESQSGYRIEYRVIKPDGSIAWIEARGNVITGTDGRPVRMAGLCMDATSRKNAEETLREEREKTLESERSARAEAERVSEMKDEFLANLSHELRTPLNAIVGWTQVLRHGSRSEADLIRGLDTIERNARVQTQLIEDLLDMSRITSGKVRLDIQPIEPVSFIEAAIESVRPAADAKGIRLEKILDASAGPISGDPNRLQQVIWNLLTNAIKFTPKGGKAQILLQRVNSHIEISVADTGIGIAPAFIAHVFERFRQGDASTTRKFGGLGLGLSIVKSLVEMHGGTVCAQSPGENQGTTFAVHLPVTVVHRHALGEGRVHPRSARGASQDFRILDLTGIKVVVVDDEMDARELIKRVLSDCHALVFTAGTAEETLRLIEREHPDVLISDIGMPDVDGYELLRRVRELGPGRGGKVPAIALTAFARSEDRTRALRAGFMVHVSKPVEPSELVATVANASGRSVAAGDM